jgi:hypothetical protein
MAKIIMILVAVMVQQVYSAPLFIVEIGDHEQIRWQQQMMRGVVNTVVTEEVRDVLSSLNSEASLKFSVIGFEAKKRLGLSIAYLTNAARDVAVLAQRAEKNVRKYGAQVGAVTISDDGGMFGVDKDHVVVKIDDREGYLRKLRSAIINGFDSALIDTKFDFVPHVDLGRLRMQEIIKFVTKRSGLHEDDELIKNMVKRIEMRLSEAVANVPNNGKLTMKIPIRIIDLYGLDRASVKKIMLG